LTFIIAGPESETVRQARMMVQAFGLQGKVYLPGGIPQEEVADLLAAADVNINPSLAEGLNMVVAEAAAVGTPSITTEASGIAAWVKRYGAGIIVRAGDRGALAEAVRRFFGLPLDERQALQEKALLMAEEFDLDRVAEGLLGIFQEALGRWRG